ncbi:extracellular solute-binding protein [Paenibacillus arenilitoris]|uniref:Extracellular solute-binding protein n=1 Tax=Paenibacillus arenilitoris TaxID=2772299 RepID=A0A927CSE9_9BACL|nr:extracellular solute-binding protein [Paenibacillus arenilitoris]MBD2871046.1 extracellular solute-binding protein [Paenibacillus arenilitoris]
MKRRLTVVKSLYTALAISVLLAGCASNGSAGKENGSTANSGAGGDSGANEAVTITTARIVGGDVTFKNGEDIDNNVHYKWAKDELGIILKNDWTVGTGDAFTTKLRLMVNTNEKLPDVFRTGDLNLATQLIDSGKLMDITEAFEQYASPRLKALFEQYPQLWYPVTVDGRRYGLPITNAVSSSNVLWIRQDWLDKLHLDAPETMEELEQVMDAFTNQDPDGNNKNDTIGMSVSLRNGVATWMASSDFIFGKAAMPTSWNKGPDGKLQYGSVQPSVKEGVSKLAKWMKKGYLDKDAGTLDESKAVESFIQGRSGMVFGPTWMASGWPFTADMNFDYKAIPLPSGIDGQQGFMAEQLTSMQFYFNKDFKHMDRFFVYLDKIMGPGFYDTESEFANGWAEGYDYVMENGEPVYDHDKIPGGFTDAKKYTLFYNDIQTPKMELEVMAKLGEGNAPETSYDKQFASRDKRWQEGAAVLKTYMDKASVLNEMTGPPTPAMSKKSELLKKMENETFLKIIYGSSPIESFDTFVEQWKKAGGDEITKEVNEWYASVIE